MNKLIIDSHEIAITNPDKIFFPENKITKGDLIDYYHNIGSIMVPYMYDRPITMHRYPGGNKI